MRPMGRATSGVIGMRFTDGDELLAMHVVRDGPDVLVATGWASPSGRPPRSIPSRPGGKGVLTARIADAPSNWSAADRAPDDSVRNHLLWRLHMHLGRQRRSPPADHGVRLINLGTEDSIVAHRRRYRESLADADAEEDARDRAGTAAAGAAPGRSITAGTEPHTSTRDAGP